MSIRPSIALPAGIFLGVFAVHAACPVMTSTDSRWSIPTALSLLREGNTDLDEYPGATGKNRHYKITQVDGRHYSQYPVAPSLLALPFVAALDAAGVNVLANCREIERGIASLVVAACAVLTFLTGRLFLDPSRSLLLAFVFAFCTSAWSTASRALWQHGPSMLLLALALYLVLRAREKPSWIDWAGLTLALAVFMRPANAIPAAVLATVVIHRHRDRLVRFLLGAAMVTPLAICFSLLGPYQPGVLIFQPSVGGFAEACAGTLVSPSRGLFIFSPILAFSLWGATLKLRRDRDPADVAIASIIILQWLLVCVWGMWWGGHSYGPRLLSETTPFLAYFLIPVIARLKPAAGPRGLATAAAFAFLTAASLFIHFRGAVSPDVHFWNSYPVNIDHATWRVWEPGDPQFLRGLR